MISLAIALLDHVEVSPTRLSNLILKAVYLSESEYVIRMSGKIAGEKQGAF